MNKKLTEIKGIGEKSSEKLRQVGVFKAADLLRLFPTRYQDYTNIKKIKEVKPKELVTIKAKIKSLNSRRSFKNRRLSITEGVLTDKTGNLEVIWFNQPYLEKSFNNNSEYYFSGKTTYNKKLQLTNPIFEPVEKDNLSTGRLSAVYSLPAGISIKKIKLAIYSLVSQLPEKIEFLPKKIIEKHNLIGLKDAIFKLHFPKDKKELKQAVLRLSFDEMLLMQKQILKRKEYLKNSQSPVINFNQGSIKSFIDSLPFTLTLDQKKAAWEIIKDLESSTPMNRLLQGDVGSGKTIVAVIASLSACLQDFQVIWLAPTQILAQQHYQVLSNLLPNYKIGILTAGLKKIEKEEITKLTANGKVNILVGTHAILNQSITYKNLGLVIIDEQHRFGVKQRSTLRNKKTNKIPHFLSMTATPIPRTLALTFFGDLKVSSIKNKPPGKPETITEIITPDNYNQVFTRTKKELKAGRQVFVICPLLEDSDFLEVKSVKAEASRLKKVLPEFNIAILHGRLKPEEKEKVMKDFKSGTYQILVSTSVIEVGIDIPNATVILIEGAERFGLTQLHQFRGRVGRGKHTSYCLLLPTEKQVPVRLKALIKYSSGFDLAEVDLILRGSGEILGNNQSGFWQTKIADLYDLDLIKKAREAAMLLINNDIKHPLFKTKQLKQKPHLE